MHIPQSVVSGCWGLLSVTVQSIPKPQSLRPRDQLVILWQPGLLLVGENCVFHNHLASSCRRLLAVANCCSPLWLLQPLVEKVQQLFADNPAIYGGHGTPAFPEQWGGFLCSSRIATSPSCPAPTTHQLVREYIFFPTCPGLCPSDFTLKQRNTTISQSLK